jgi:hypothetical protein
VTNTYLVLMNPPYEKIKKCGPNSPLPLEHSKLRRQCLSSDNCIYIYVLRPRNTRYRK